MRKRLHLRISGRVQGVAFRHFTWSHASRLGLHGWVRNLPDGSVEVLAEGEEESLAALLQLVRRGPPAARVRDIDERWSEPQGDLPAFTVAF